MTTPTRSLSPEEAAARRRQQDEWWKKIKALGGPATNTMIEELVALDPEHAQEHWDRWNSVGFGKDEVRALMAELRKPRLPKTEGVAELANRQSSEQLFTRHEEEVRKAKEAWDRAAAHNARARAESRREAYDPAAAERDRFQSVIDHWGNAKHFAAEAERKLREDLDPCNLGLYGIHGTLYGRDGR
jgi:hypothetical protein